MNGNNKRSDIKRRRIIALLTREEMEFLDKLSIDSLFSTGHKLFYNQILRGLIEFAMEVGVSGERANSSQILKGRILQQLMTYTAVSRKP